MRFQRYVNVQNTRKQIKHDSGDIQDDLRHRPWRADRVADNQSQKNPVNRAPKAARYKRQRRQQKSIQKVGEKNDPLHLHHRQPPGPEQQQSHYYIDQEINQKKPLHHLLRNGARDRHIFQPARKIEMEQQNRYEHRLHRQNDVLLHRTQSHCHLLRRRRSIAQQLAKLLEIGPDLQFHAFGPNPEESAFMPLAYTLSELWPNSTLD